MSIATDLAEAQANFATKLKEFSANPQPTYTVEGESVQWDKYLDMLASGLKTTNELIALFDPYELRSVVR